MEERPPVERKAAGSIPVRGAWEGCQSGNWDGLLRRCPGHTGGGSIPSPSARGRRPSRCRGRSDKSVAAWFDTTAAHHAPVAQRRSSGLRNRGMQVRLLSGVLVGTWRSLECAPALGVQLRPPPPSGRRPAGRGAPLEAVYSARALGGFESRAFRLGEATRLATGAVLKTVRAQASWVRPPPSPLAGREHDPVNAAGSYPVDQGSNPWRPTNRCVACAGCALGPPKLLVPGSTPGRRTPLPR